MAMENLQMSTLYAATTPKAGAPLRFHSFSSKEKLDLPKYTGLKNPILSFSSSPSSFARSVSSSTSRKSRGVSCKAREAVDEVRAVTDSSWNELVIGNESMVLVDFWAPWCGPCRMIAPVIEELAKEYRGKIACFKLNTDDCPTIATQYGIRSIPTVLFFKNGQKKESVIGAVPKSTLSATIDKYLEL